MFHLHPSHPDHINCDTNSKQNDEVTRKSRTAPTIIDDDSHKRKFVGHDELLRESLDKVARTTLYEILRMKTDHPIVLFFLYRPTMHV